MVRAERVRLLGLKAHASGPALRPRHNWSCHSSNMGSVWSLPSIVLQNLLHSSRALLQAPWRRRSQSWIRQEVTPSVRRLTASTRQSMIGLMMSVAAVSAAGVATVHNLWESGDRSRYGYGCWTCLRRSPHAPSSTSHNW